MTAAPNLLNPRFDAIPETIRILPRWVGWKAVPDLDKGKFSKIPLQTSGRLTQSSNPGTWRLVPENDVTMASS
jgi:primase-polymerase (primpol)-like protein